MMTLSKNETEKKIDADTKLRDGLQQIIKDNPEGVDIPAIAQRAYALDKKIEFQRALSNPIPIPK